MLETPVGLDYGQSLPFVLASSNLNGRFKHEHVMKQRDPAILAEVVNDLQSGKIP